MMSAPQQAPQQPPIAQQVMRQAEADTGQGVDRLPSNLPTQAMREGGIVAFADGGDVEDDYDDQGPEEEEYLQGLQMAMENGELAAELGGAGISALPAKEKSFVNKTPDVEQGIRISEQGIKQGSGIAGLKGKEFYNTMYDTLLSQAKEAGVKNPEAIARLGAAQSALETGYGKSTAGGNNYFGIKGVGTKQPTKEYNAQTGRMEDTTDTFRKYGSMNESAADYINFLQKNPRYARILEAENPEQAIALQGRSGYATDPNYGNKLSAIHRSNMGIAALASGGSIKHFGAGGETYDEALNRQNAALDALNQGMPDKFSTYMGPRSKYLSNPENVKYEMDRNAAINAIKGNIPLPAKPLSSESAKAYGNIYGRTPDIPVLPPTPVVSNTPNAASQGDARKFEMDQLARQNLASGANQEADDSIRADNAGMVSYGKAAQADGENAPTSAAPRNAFDSYMDRLNKRQDEIAQQKEEDKYMALLTAGLGMMGGTSPFAFSNIGQGAMAGVSSYGQSARQRAAEQNAIDRNMVMAQRYKDLGAIASQNMNLTAEQRKIQNDLRQQQLEQTSSQAKMNALTRLDQVLDASIGQDLKGTPEQLMDPGYITQQKMIHKLQDPRYRAAYKDAMGFEAPQVPIPGGVVVNKVTK